MSNDTFEELAGAYATAVATRRNAERNLRAEILGAYSNRAEEVRAAAAAEADAKAALSAAVEAAPELFERPRTRTVHGIRFGWITGKPRIEIPDEARTIQRIEQTVPEEQAILLIRTRKAVHKPALADLTAADCKRLGIRILPAEDVVVVRAAEDGVDKLVGLVLDEADRAREGTE